MTEKFIQLKKRAKTRCVFFTALFGASSALFVVGGLLLLFKLLQADFPRYGYALCALGAGGSVGGILFLCSYPFEKRFARRLDERYGLDERVRTMIEYDGQEGAVLALQRADTDAHLAAIPKKKYGFWQIFALCLLPIFAVGIFVGSFFVPNKEKPDVPPPEEPPKEEELAQPTEYATEDLKKIIENVKASQLSEGLKTVNVTVLEGLLADLEEDGIVEKASVSEGMLTIMTATIAENSYNAFATGNQEATLKTLNKALTDSERAYEKIADTNVYDYTTLQDKRPSVEIKVLETLSTYANNENEKIGAFTDIADYVDFAKGYIDAIDSTLARESVVALPDDDGVKKAFVALKTGLAETLNGNKNGLAVGLELAGAKLVAKGYFTSFIANGAQTEGVAVALGRQAYTYMIRDYVVKGLSKIFGVPVPELATEEGAPPVVEGGGGGGGEFSYANDGIVYDPTDRTYKPYGEVLAKYYDRVLALLADDDSAAAAELKGYIKAYFEELH